MDKEINNIYELIDGINNIKIEEIYIQNRRRYIKYYYDNEFFNTDVYSFKLKIKSIKSGKKKRYSLKEVNNIIKKHNSNLEVKEIINEKGRRYCILFYYNDCIKLEISQTIRLKFDLDEENRIFKQTKWTEDRIKLYLQYNYPNLIFQDKFIKSKQIWIDVYDKSSETYNTLCLHKLIKKGYMFNDGHSSLGEKRIKEVLDELNINYIREYSFEDLIYIRRLRFDFYLKDYNTLIEFNGRQHYEDLDYFKHAIDSFEQRKIKDLMKQDYCKKNNLNLIIIPYYEFDNIRKIIYDIVHKK